jgi:outer membrane murein-binding lipoprotein Lpp
VDQQPPDPNTRAHLDLLWKIAHRMEPPVRPADLVPTMPIPGPQKPNSGRSPIDRLRAKVEQLESQVERVRTGAVPAGSGAIDTLLVQLEQAKAMLHRAEQFPDRPPGVVG